MQKKWGIHGYKNENSTEALSYLYGIHIARNISDIPVGFFVEARTSFPSPNRFI